MDALKVFISELFYKNFNIKKKKINILTIF